GSCLLLWDFLEGKLLRSLTKHPEPIREIAFSPDGKRVAALGNGTTRLWDALTGGLITKLESKAKLEDKTIAKEYGKLAFTPDGRFLATGIAGGNIDLWAIPSGQHEAHLNVGYSAPSGLVFAGDHTLLISNFHVLLMWDLDKRSFINRHESHESD